MLHGIIWNQVYAAKEEERAGVETITPIDATCKHSLVRAHNFFNQNSGIWISVTDTGISARYKETNKRSKLVLRGQVVPLYGEQTWLPTGFSLSLG